MPRQRRRSRQPIACSRCQCPEPRKNDAERDYWIRLDIHGMQACNPGNPLCGRCTWDFLIFMDYTPDGNKSIEFVDAQFDGYQRRYAATAAESVKTDKTMH